MPRCSPFAGRVVVFSVHSKDAQPFIASMRNKIEENGRNVRLLWKDHHSPAPIWTCGWHVSLFSLVPLNTIIFDHICSCDMHPSHTLVTVVAAKRTILRKNMRKQSAICWARTSSLNDAAKFRECMLWEQCTVSFQISPVSVIHEFSSFVQSQMISAHLYTL